MRFLTTLLVLMLLSAASMAEEPAGSVCPADHAANKGFAAFGAFHEVMAPAWHTAYPAKDLDALIAAGPKFDSLFKGIADIQPTMKNTKRKAAFLNNREEFAHLIKAYAAAAKSGLKDSCYAMMPKVHEAFENTASVIMPYEFPALDGIATTVGVIVDQHIPKNNMEGIVGSTETLVTKVNALNEKIIPDELKDQQEGLVNEFVLIAKLTAQLKESCDKKDMESYKKYAIELSSKLKEVSETYL